MSGKEIEKRHNKTFEGIKHTGSDGQEFWMARDLQTVLEYASWDKFRRVLVKAAMACDKAGQIEQDHFSQVGKMVTLGSGAEREIEDFELSRYACYLVVQNADPAKSIVAQGQSYFAIQTRRQELADDDAFQRLKEDEKRLFLRNELKEHNKHLVSAAKNAGVETTLDFAVFQNHGYKGLYGGLDAKGIHRRKQLKKSHKILDHMGSTELAANLFRATQTEEKLLRENIQGKRNANQTHQEVGAKVRQTIKDLGGTMPENLPTPEKSKQAVERKRKKKIADESKQ